MMKRSRSKFLAALLALVMVLAMLPAAAFAEGDSDIQAGNSAIEDVDSSLALQSGTEIATINISGLSAVKIGNPIADNQAAVTTPHIELTGGWTDEEGKELARGKFQFGTTYFYTIRLDAEDGYTIADNVQVIYEGTQLTKLKRAEFTSNNTGYMLLNGAVLVKIAADDVIVAPLAITQQPRETSVNEGESASFTVQVSGGVAPYTYEWIVSTATYQGSYDGDATFTILKTVREYDDGMYFCRITDAAGNAVDSDRVALNINDSDGPLTITRQPQNITVNEGESASFTVQVSGGKAPYTYKWIVSTATYDGSYDGDSTFTILKTDREYDDGMYFCRITDATGSSIDSDSVALTVNDKKEDPCAAFTDINRDAWYHNAVDYAISNGLMAGMSATEFAPNGRVTRAQIVQILYNMEGKPAVTYTNKFTDVTSGDWFASAVLWAADKGVVSGMGDGLFAPNANLTREQAATILYNYFTKRGDDTSDRADLSKFPDHQSVSSWALAPFQWANAKGIINGTNTGTQTILDPQGGTTRAQIAQIFFNISKLN